MNRVVVGAGDCGLVLGDVARNKRGEIQSIHVEITDLGLHAELIVSSHYALGFDDLVTFFATMVRDWRGWNGGRIYESLEGDLRITGRHLGSSVQLTVELTPTSQPDGWFARTIFTFDAGEQLKTIAGELAVLLGMPQE